MPMLWSKLKKLWAIKSCGVFLFPPLLWVACLICGHRISQKVMKIRLIALNMAGIWLKMITFMVSCCFMLCLCGIFLWCLVVSCSVFVVSTTACLVCGHKISQKENQTMWYIFVVSCCFMLCLCGIFMWCLVASCCVFMVSFCGVLLFHCVFVVSFHGVLLFHVVSLLCLAWSVVEIRLEIYLCVILLWCLVVSGCIFIVSCLVCNLKLDWKSVFVVSFCSVLLYLVVYLPG